MSSLILGDPFAAVLRVSEDRGMKRKQDYPIFTSVIACIGEWDINALKIPSPQTAPRRSETKVVAP
jgi:hypothetical protein